MKLTQLFLLTVVALVVWSATGSVVAALVGAIIGLAVLLLTPQLMFKSSVRTLSIDASGVSTVIGSRSGQVSWSDVLAVEDDGERVFIIRKNLNSFAVPRRAFAGEEERRAFLELARGWHGSTQRAGSRR